jgi:hypothetical protein
MAAMSTILDLVSIDFLTNAWVDWSDYLVAHWGSLDEGRLLSMTSMVLRQPSWIWIPSII